MALRNDSKGNERSTGECLVVIPLAENQGEQSDWVATVSACDSTESSRVSWSAVPVAMNAVTRDSLIDLEGKSHEQVRRPAQDQLPSSGLYQLQATLKSSQDITVGLAPTAPLCLGAGAPNPGLQPLME